MIILCLENFIKLQYRYILLIYVKLDISNISKYGNFNNIVSLKNYNEHLIIQGSYKHTKQNPNQPQCTYKYRPFVCMAFNANP